MQSQQMYLKRESIQVVPGVQNWLAKRTYAVLL